MNIKIIVSIAAAMLMARWRQTLVAAVGVTFGITMFISLLGFMNGLNTLLDGLMLNRSPHVRLYNDVKPSLKQPIKKSKAYASSYPFIHSVKANNTRKALYNSAAIVQAIKKDTRVLGVAPKITAQVFFNEGNVDITGVVNGIDVAAESSLFHFSDYVNNGKPTDLQIVNNSIILGNGLAQKLLAYPGDVIQVTTAGGKQFPLKVVALFQSGMREFDNVHSYASIATVQKILGEPANYITDLQIKLLDLKQAPKVALEYAQLFEVDAEDIQTANAQFETGSSVRTLISYAVGITLLVVAGFGIYNILNMMIYEKMDSIAILKATGFSGADVKRIFLLIALTIGLAGGGAGLLFGYALSSIIDQIPFRTDALPTVTTYPVDYSFIYYFIAILFSLATTYFAGFFPARKASKVDPVIIIRGK
jgi:lipoprotein-releasing system permease protein